MLKRFSGTSPNIGVRAPDLRVIKNKIPQLASALNIGFDAGKFYSVARIKALKTYWQCCIIFQNPPSDPDNTAAGLSALT
ncbi:MAG: hypothetical protein ACN6P5_13590 [Pseudomonas protegens]|uniref:hypothetical protein n=1 Tax=Pseudomonas protegens TaxID=380021 RepID=UPI00383AB218